MSENVYPASLPKAQTFALVAGVVGAIVSGVWWAIRPDEFYHSYLMAYLLWLGIAIGSLALLKIQHLTGGGWGYSVRRILESAAMTLPFMLILFIPIAIGVKSLYIWADPSVMANDHILQEKQKYLNVPFFWGRAVIYFLIWSSFAFLLNKWSREQDNATSTEQAIKLAEKCQRISAPGLLILGLTMTFASVDWVMSMEPHWASTIFGMLTLGGQLLSAFAFAIIMITRLSKDKPVSEKMRVVYLHDLSKLMLAFVVLWSYFSLSQFLIIWSGNLPEENVWYLIRQQGGWKYIGVAIIFLNFAIPFLMLLSRNTKTRAERASKVALYILATRLLDLFWVVKPELHDGKLGFEIAVSDIAAPIGVGGIWLFIFLMNLRKKALLPQRDPYIKEIPAHGHH